MTFYIVHLHLYPTVTLMSNILKLTGRRRVSDILRFLWVFHPEGNNHFSCF